MPKSTKTKEVLVSPAVTKKRGWTDFRKSQSIDL